MKRNRKESQKITTSLTIVLVLATLILTLGACGNSAGGNDTPESVVQTAQSASESQESETASGQESREETQEQTVAAPTDIRVGSLKGPTTMGIVNLMKKTQNGGTDDNYEFIMAAAADEISAKLVSEELDIALVPANLASVLYNKTEGKIKVIDINTLGVLYCVTGDDSIKSLSDLAGKTVITTGQGTTPEYAMRTVLDRSGITDCTLEFKSEATEVAALLQQDATQIAVLPQPFVTVAMMQNDALSIAFSISDAWDRLEESSRLVTGVTVVRAAFLEEHADAVARFLAEHAESADKANTDVAGTSELVAEYGIIEKAPVAAKALPYCNIVCIRDEEMKTAVSGYLSTLFEQNPQSVGGALPQDDFYVSLAQ